MKLINGKCIARCTKDCDGDSSGLDLLLHNMCTCVGSDVQLVDGQCTSSEIMGVCTGDDLKLVDSVWRLM
eukprot:scaffold330345_cov53-Tisochrysis_lutea.AAC.1